MQYKIIEFSQLNLYEKLLLIHYEVLVLGFLKIMQIIDEI